MAQQILNENSVTPNDGLGDTPPVYTQKINDNFTEIFTLAAEREVENTVLVNQDNISTTLGGDIDSTKAYLVDGVIDFTGTGLNIEVPAGGLSIIGTTYDVSKIICSDNNYNLFTSPVGGSGNLITNHIEFQISGTGSQVHALTDVDSNHSVEHDQINFSNCSSLGYLDSYRQYSEANTGRFGGMPQLELIGAWSGGCFIDSSLVRGLTDGSYSLFKAGTGFVMQSRFRSNQNIDLPASASFFDFNEVNFPNSSTLQLSDCILTRDGVSDASDTNITPNITAANLSSQWKGNNGIQNTFVGGELEVTAEVSTTITSSGVFVDLNGTYTASDLQHFDSPSNGQLRHLGSTPREFLVQGEFILDSSANDEIDLKVTVYRSETATFEDYKTIRRVINNLQGGKDVAYFSLYSNIVLGQNDYVKLMVANVDDNNNITAETGSSFIVGAR